MTWFKVDDGFPTHAKTDALGDDQAVAVACWTLCGAACMRDLTDGLVTTAALRRTLALWPTRDQKRAADALVRAGMWHVDPEGWRFHDWLSHQPSRDAVLAERARKAQNQRASRERRRDGDTSASHQRVTTPVTGDNGGDVSGDRSVSHRGPDPTRPVPSSSLRSDDHVGSKGLSLVRAPDEPTPEERIEDLAKRYPAPLLAAVHDACRLSRSTGRMAPSVWLATLERLALIDAGHVVASMQAFLAGDHGPKGERYLVGIARNETKRGTAKPSAWRPPVAPEAYAASASTEADDAAALAALTDEDRAWLARKGVAHG